MLTGQISSQALHVVQAHTSSEVIRSKRLLAPTVISGSTPSGGDTAGVPVRAMTSPVLSTISRGSSGLPVAWAGHTDVQRPHMVQASVSSSCFQVKSSMVEAPKLSSSVSMRFGIGFMAPLGRSRSFRYMFSGEVNMWRSIVTGRIATKSEEAGDVGDPPDLVAAGQVAAAVDQARQRVADERPLLEVGPAVEGDAPDLGAEAGDADGEERAEDERVLGLGLDADAVRPLHVAADDRPHDADEEREAGDVADERRSPGRRRRGGT